MGSYLSEPITDKISTDESNDKLAYGASSMQGWRVSQEGSLLDSMRFLIYINDLAYIDVEEFTLRGNNDLVMDAHNSILDYNESEAFFAVYDGHGGHEVAHYCARKLPDFIKNTEAYKKGDLEEALVEGFLKFDASIATAEVVASLKEIAGDKEAEEETDDEENFNNLYEEASMPIEKVIEKYTNLVNPALKNLKKGEKLPRSPMISAKKDSPAIAPVSSSTTAEAGGSSKDIAQAASSSSSSAESSSSGSSNGEAVTSSCSSEVNGEEKTEDAVDPLQIKPECNGPIPEIKVSDADSSESQEAASVDLKASDKDEKKTETPTQNGDIAGEKGETEEANSVSSTNDGDVTAVKGKGKSPLKKAPKTPINTRPKRNATQLYKKLLSFPEESEDDTEDEEDKTFEEPREDSSDDEPMNVSIEEAEESGEDSSEAEEEDAEDGELDDDEDEDDLEFARNMKEEPGSDSGCTAVVAILKGSELYVANAGDSRCIVCRNGKAIDMSFDHKPEDEPERNRIMKAGGKVTADGRVNGGLNLSRALGDHAYKQNKDLDDREQMITALPDVKKLTISPTEDEFMVLACDGIWNFMSSQEVVDFVKPRLDDKKNKVSQICEEMFDHCLAPNTMGDGTGCDNMTAIIVQFKQNLKKRCISPEPGSADSSESKRAKTDDVPSTNAETSSS